MYYFEDWKSTNHERAVSVQVQILHELSYMSSFENTNRSVTKEGLESSCCCCLVGSCLFLQGNVKKSNLVVLLHVVFLF